MSQTSSYDVVVGAVATVMRVTKVPTENPLTPGNYTFVGYLETADGVGLENQTVELLVDDVVVGTQVTNIPDPGYWSFSFALEPGATYAVKAAFAGTAEYEASATDVYSVTPSKIATGMLVFIAPPATADVGVPFAFGGALREMPMLPPVGIEGATVNLYVGGSLAGSTTTGSDGSWTFDVAIDTPGTHVIYADFLGDAKYLGCSGDSPASWLAPTGLLALVGMVCLAL